MRFSSFLCSCVSDPEAVTAPLASQACERLWYGFRPSTLAAYRRMFALVLSFLVTVGLSLPQVSTLDILAFMEYLLQAGMTAANIINHLTTIRFCCIIYNIDTTPFRDNGIPLFIKSIKINRSFQPSSKIVIDEKLLDSIFKVCLHLPFPEVFKILYLLAYFSFLRLSSILPHTLATFDTTMHLRVGDIIFSNQGAVIVVKWTKTFQDRCKVATVSLPNLGASSLCPIAALKIMLNSKYPDKDTPLFQIRHNSVVVPLTDSYACKHLKKVSKSLELPKSIIFHDFCRGGATWAFKYGVPIQDIQAQGTWSSSCVWRYINISPALSSMVSSTFQAHLAV